MNLPCKQLACLLERYRLLARTLQDNRNTRTDTQVYFHAECEFRIHDLTVRCLEDNICPSLHGQYNRLKTLVHWLSGKFRNVQNSPPMRRPSGARQVLLSSNEFDELRRENRIALSCLVIVLCFFM